jgi:hypothetical protein
MISQRESHKDTQKSPIKRFLFVLGMVFFLLYLALGVMIIFWDNIPLNISHTGRVAFGALLIGYSFFRFVRLWQNRND